MTSTTVEHLPGCRVVTGRADRELCILCRTKDLPDIDADRLNGFRKMAVAVVDDMLEAATDMAGRHTHQLDGLKKRVEDLEAENHRLDASAAEACAILETATGNAIHDVVEAAKNAAELIATLRHRIDETQKQMTAIAAEAAPQFLGLTVGDLAEVLKEEADGEFDAAVKKCLIIDDGTIAVVDTIRELCAQLRFLDNAVGDMPVAEPKRTYPVVVVEPLPQAGPWVITRKDAHGRRFWGPGPMGGTAWLDGIAGAFQYADAPTAERRKPRGSRVVTLADARELIEAEKVVTLAPVEPTGPEAA